MYSKIRGSHDKTQLFVYICNNQVQLYKGRKPSNKENKPDSIDYVTCTNSIRDV